MLKNLSGLECKVQDRDIKLICDFDCPTMHIKEALFQFSKLIGQIEDAAKAKQEAEQANVEESPVEESKPE